MKNNLGGLKKKWDQILKDSGFEDIEDSRGHLKTPDPRTISFDNRDLILNFHLSLSAYLEHTKEIPPTHRRILELYSCGIYIKAIALKTELSDRWVRKVIRLYQYKILGRPRE